MADDHKEGHDIMKDVWFVVGVVVVLIILWYMSGANKSTTIKDLFLPSPLEHSTSTEPQFGGGTVAPPPTVQY